MTNKSNPKKNKHLTSEDRTEIQECLNRRMSFKDIARLLGKDPTTISYEVKHHRMEHKSGFSSLDAPCPSLLKAPFVCNGCPKRSLASCRYIRFLYNAGKAHGEYKSLLSEAREGIPLNKESFYSQDRIITDGLYKGQHLYHIMSNNDGVVSSKSTVYRHFHKGYYSASLIDLPRAVKFKPRNTPHPEYVPSGLKIGRSFDLFSDLISSNPDIPVTELDTVIGEIGGKVILTIHFVDCDFMIGRLLPNKSSAEASKAIIRLKQDLLAAGFSFADLMPVLLADNGGEFSDVFSFENDQYGNQESKMFFCDPMRSCQKPHIEKNHTLFRDIVPKGHSFNCFSQKDVDLIFSHVNAVSRKQFHGKSAYDMFTFSLSEKLAGVLGISRIAPEDVIQSPILLKNLGL